MGSRHQPALSPNPHSPLSPIGACASPIQSFSITKHPSSFSLQLTERSVRMRAMKHTDAERFRFLASMMDGMKWADALPGLKPEDEKYITPESLRARIDEMLNARPPSPSSP